MSKKEKLIKRLKMRPADFTISELETLLDGFGYMRQDKGRTSGSRIIYICDDHPPIMLHRPHPGNELKRYQINQVIDLFEQEGLI